MKTLNAESPGPHAGSLAPEARLIPCTLYIVETLPLPIRRHTTKQHPPAPSADGESKIPLESKMVLAPQKSSPVFASRAAASFDQPGRELLPLSVDHPPGDLP